MSQSSSSGGGIPGLSADRARGKADAQTTAAFVEDNIYLGERWIVTPGLRFDHHSQFGNNTSPSLNAQFRINSDWVVKGGIARAFKAPNLYQSNPDYLYYTRGNGCPNALPSLGAGCYMRGNADLKAETSLNKELGIEWAPQSGWQASLTYFHNDYKDKIQAGYTQIGLTADTKGRIFRWENAPKAIVQGLEGNLVIPLLGEQGNRLKWSNNFTYMVENENKTTHQPLSVIPKYTINTMLDWQATDRLSVLLTGTFYGRQEPATTNINNDPRCTGSCDASIALQDRGAYNIWGVSARYKVTETVSFGFSEQSGRQALVPRGQQQRCRGGDLQRAGPRILGQPALRLLTAGGRRSAALAGPCPARARVACNVINIVIVSPPAPRSLHRIAKELLPWATTTTTCHPRSATRNPCGGHSA